MIEIKKINSEYDGLRKLWCDTFGDSPEVVNEMYAAWGADIEGYVLVEDNGVLGPENNRRVVAALTLLKMGDLVQPAAIAKKSNLSNNIDAAKIVANAKNSDKTGMPCYVSYAICTDENEQGKGYGSTITEFAKDLAWKKGGVSMLCPANNKLIGFYMPLGYEPRFYASEGSVECTAGAECNSCNGSLNIIAEIREISASEYNNLREQMLADIVHIRLNEHTLSYIEQTSKSFVTINNGDLIAVIDRLGTKKLHLSEMLSRSEMVDIKAMLEALGNHYGKQTVEYRTVGDDYLQTGAFGGEYLQAMIAAESGCDFSRGYFGFPFD